MENKDIHQALGYLTRQLHEALNGLGMLKSVQEIAGEIPDARSRLSYIARLTGEAADKVLTIVEEQKQVSSEVYAANQKVKALIKANPSMLANDPRILVHLEHVGNTAQATDVELTNIMMAQDFHDLTNQVIAKVVSLTVNIEHQLVNLLLQHAQNAPAEVKTVDPLTPQTYEPVGPAVVISANTVSSQSEVDDLLASLGF